MLIFDDHNDTIIVDNIHVPTACEYFWILDLNIKEYTLTPLLILEEITSPVITVSVDGFHFKVPANWNILVSDEETTQVDIIEISEIAGKEFQAVVYGPNHKAAMMSPISVVDYDSSASIVSPSLHKHQMLCHPINPTSFVCVTPYDTYNKYFKNCLMGDFI